MIDDFAADGQLAKAIPGFKPREPQRQMAVAVSEAIEASRPLVVEAGTGTGKTYAYLAPALRAKKGDYLHRVESAAGSALQPRSAHRRQSAQIHRQTGAAQRALQLPVPRTPGTAGAGGRRSAGANPQRRDPPALLVEPNSGWRYQHLRQRGGRFPGLAAGHQHQR